MTTEKEREIMCANFDVKFKQVIFLMKFDLIFKLTTHPSIIS